MMVPSAFVSGSIFTSTSSGLGGSKRGLSRLSPKERAPSRGGRGPSRLSPNGLRSVRGRSLPSARGARGSSRSGENLPALTPAAFFAQSGVKSNEPRSKVAVSFASIST